jgi:hypothetical protein
MNEHGRHEILLRSIWATVLFLVQLDCTGVTTQRGGHMCSWARSRTCFALASANGRCIDPALAPPLLVRSEAYAAARTATLERNFPRLRKV